MWCRPWLIDPGRSTPLPRTPEIARAALEATDAHHEIECFDSDPAFRDRLSARVGEHLKVLRRKIIERGLVRPGIRLSDEVAVGVLIDNGTIAPSDLARLDRSRLVLPPGRPLVDPGQLAAATRRPAPGSGAADLESGLRPGTTRPGDQHRVVPRGDLAAEELVLLVERVGERPGPVGDGVHRRHTHPRQGDGQAGPGAQPRPYTTKAVSPSPNLWLMAARGWPGAPMARAGGLPPGWMPGGGGGGCWVTVLTGWG